MMFQNFVNVTPHDANPAPANNAIYVGTGGNISLTSRHPVDFTGGTPTYEETTVVLQNIPNGTLLPISAYRINATGTTATNIVAVSF